MPPLPSSIFAVSDPHQAHWFTKLDFGLPGINREAKRLVLRPAFCCCSAASVDLLSEDQASNSKGPSAGTFPVWSTSELRESCVPMRS